MGKWIRDEAVITSHKHEVQGAALLDDRPALRSAGLASWRHVLFVPSGTSYGKDVDTPFKLHGWGDPMLETILAHCVRRPMPRVGTPVKL